MSEVLYAEIPGSPPTKYVLLVLANYADARGGRVFPSVSTVVKITGSSTATVRRAIAEAKRAGFLVLVRTAHRHSPCEYRIALDVLAQLPRAIQERPPRSERVHGETPQDETAPTERPHPEAEGDHTERQGDHPETQSVSEPSTTRTAVPPIAPQGRQCVTDGFEDNDSQGHGPTPPPPAGAAVATSSGQEPVRGRNGPVGTASAPALLGANGEGRATHRRRTSVAKSDPTLEAQAREILAYLNERTGHAYEAVDVNLKFIVGRLQDRAQQGDAAPVETCRRVIDVKVREWHSDPDMAKFLRPATLFNRTKFAQYVGQLSNGNGPSPAPQLTKKEQRTVEAAQGWAKKNRAEGEH
jgi:uncharacterized phage protein (TIGR02220 family)